MGTYRGYKTLIIEAELLASPAPKVADWLRERAATADFSFDHAGDDELEAALLQRDDSLVTLALARFGLSEEVLQTLFARTDVPALRLAVLSNVGYPKVHWHFPASLTPDSDDWNWVTSLSDDELTALFENEELPDGFVGDFLEGNAAWPHLDDRRRQLALRLMSKKLSKRGEYDGHWDGYADYSHNKVFDLAWQLAARVPVTRQWANALYHLYSQLRAQSFSVEKPLEIAARWHPEEGDKDERADETKSNKRGRLSAYQNVRLGLGRLSARLANDKEIRADLLASDDVALRCAAYRVLRMTPEEIIAAYERDKFLAVDQLQQNDELWKCEDTREALRQVSWRTSEDDRGSDLMYAEFYSRKRDRIETEQPSWLADATEQRADFETESSPANDITALARRLANLETAIANQRTVGWIIVALLAVLLIWRGRL